MKTNTDLPGVGTLRSAVPETMRRFGSEIRAAAPLWYIQLRYSLVNRFRSSAGLPETIEIDGADVEYRSTLPRDRFPVDDDEITDSRLYHEPIVGSFGGPWDRFKTTWEETIFYESLRKRYCEGCDWQETAYYDWYVESSEKSLAPEERFRDIDRLFESMKRRGYVPNAGFHDGAENDMENPRLKTRTILGETFPDEPVVGIGRDGEVIRLAGGHHRLSLAKLQDIEDIPVIVAVRHGRWEDVRDAFGSAPDPDAVPPKYRRYAGHPDLEANRPDQFEAGVTT